MSGAPADRALQPGELPEVGVVGFMVCAAEDLTARSDFLAGIASGGWGLQPPESSRN